MTTTTDKLAAALRALLAAPDPCDCGIQGCGATECPTTRRDSAYMDARAALAEYEAAPVVTGEVRAPEPWRVGTEKFGGVVIVDATGECVAMVTPDGTGDEADHARRIVAAVNACAGIPTAELEAGCVADWRRTASGEPERGPAPYVGRWMARTNTHGDALPWAGGIENTEVAFFRDRAEAERWRKADGYAYSLAEVRDGADWPAGVRFIAMNPEEYKGGAA